MQSYKTLPQLPLASAGLGLRRPHLPDIIAQMPKVDFFELAPENWLKVGGKRAKALNFIVEHYPVIAHGLSLSIGGPMPLDKEFLADLKQFLDSYKFIIYSEHLSYCSDEGLLYDLLPIPFTEEAVHYVADRIKQVQETLERPLVLENISYYLNMNRSLSEIALSEIEFINAVIAESGCQLLLDVNNVYVNSVNHGYDAEKFISALTPNKIAYLHMAGHWQQKPNLILDTHGADIVDPVWKLLAFTYQQFGNIPTLLERDSDIPPLKIMLQELQQIKATQIKTAQAKADKNV